MIARRTSLWMLDLSDRVLRYSVTFVGVLAIAWAMSGQVGAQDPLETFNKEHKLISAIALELSALRDTPEFVSICRELATKLDKAVVRGRAAPQDKVTALLTETEKVVAEVVATRIPRDLPTQQRWVKSMSTVVDGLKQKLGSNDVDFEKWAAAYERAKEVLVVSANNQLPTGVGSPAVVASVGTAPPAGLISATPPATSQTGVVELFMAARKKNNVPYLDQNPIASAIEFKRVYVDLQSKLASFAQDTTGFPDNLKAEHKKRVNDIMDRMPGRRDDWFPVFAELDNKLGVEISAGRFVPTDATRWAKILTEMERAFELTIEELQKSDKAINSGPQASNSQSGSGSGTRGRSGSSAHLSSVWHERHMSHIYRTHDRRLNRIDRVVERR